MGIEESPRGVERRAAMVEPLIVLQDESVEIKGVRPELMDYVAEMGRLHYYMFKKPLVITSAIRRSDWIASEHYQGRAVDVRMPSLPAEDELLFHMVLVALGKKNSIRVYAGCGMSPVAHFHLELGA